MKKNVLPPETIRYIAALEKQVATQKDLIAAQKDLIDAMQRQKQELDSKLHVFLDQLETSEKQERQKEE